MVQIALIINTKVRIFITVRFYPKPSSYCVSKAHPDNLLSSVRIITLNQNKPQKKGSGLVRKPKNNFSRRFTWTNADSDSLIKSAFVHVNLRLNKFFLNEPLLKKNHVSLFLYFVKMKRILTKNLL